MGRTSLDTGKVKVLAFPFLINCPGDGMYQFKKNLNREAFFRFDNKWIEHMNWAMLPKASKAILPVIAVHCNEAGESFPGERTIAILSGLTDKVVRVGIRGLIGFPGFSFSHYVTREGRRSKRFSIQLPHEQEKDRYFFFYRCLIEGGNWQRLKYVSQALYPVMRYFATFDPSFYLEAGNFETPEVPFDQEEFKDLYRERRWDLCRAELVIMAAHAGISLRSVYTALNDLEQCFLIERLRADFEGSKRWKVFIVPPKRYTAGFLNKVVLKRYRCEIEP
jgi:hypothetical protein